MNNVTGKFYLIDTKVGKRAEFDMVDEARRALREWIDLQRKAGEPVIKLASGEWKDSKLSIWISDSDGKIASVED